MGNGINLNTHDWEGIAGNPEGYPKLDGRSVRCVKLDPEICYESSTEGTEFYVAFGQNSHNAASTVFLAVDVAAKVNTNVTFTYSIDGTMQTQMVAAGSVYRFVPVDNTKLYPSGAHTLKTLKITSDQPISVYAFNTASATTDATIVLPTSSWGKSYFLVSYQPSSALETSQQLIVAKEDGTTVTVFRADGTAETPVTLQKGEVYTYYGTGGEDITGSSVAANKPVGVFSHVSSNRVPNDRYYSDILFEQMMSVERWGKKFLVPNATQGPNSLKNRIRILASQNGTTVNYSTSGASPVSVSGSTVIASGGTLNAKQFVELEIKNPGDQYCVIESDKPVAVCSYLVGGNGTSIINVTGDPALAWIPALDQMLINTLIQPFMFTIGSSLSYTNLDGTYNANTSEVHHRAIIITRTAEKTSTTVNGTLLSSFWAGDSWTDDASSGHSYLVHEFDNTVDYQKNFLIQNPLGVMVLNYGYGTVESYYYNAASGTCLRGLHPAYHGPSTKEICIGAAASFPATPTGYTYTWSPSTLSSTTSGSYSVTVRDDATGMTQTYQNALTVTVNAIPTAPTPATSQYFCNSATVANLTPAPSATVKWYNSSNAELTDSTALTNGATYYCKAVSGGCESAKSNSVTAWIVSCSAALTTFVNVMYDFQHQTLEAFATAGGPFTDYQWQYSQTGTAADFVNCPGTSNQATYEIPADFVYDYGAGTAYADTVYFRCLLSKSSISNDVSTDETFNIIFIKTKVSKNGGLNTTDGYGQDGNVKYLTLQKGESGVVGAGALKMVLLNLGQSEGDDAGDLGDFYQWGRVADGHQKTTWSKNSSHVNQILPMDGTVTSEVVSFDTANPPTYHAADNQVSSASTAYYGKFITSFVTNGDNDWYYSNGVHDNSLWGNASYNYSSRASDIPLNQWIYPSNNPCPGGGWYVPSRWNFWDLIKGNGTDTSPASSTYDATDNTWTWRACNAYNSTAIGGAVVTNASGAKVFLPAAGARNPADGVLDYLGDVGFYWSITTRPSTGESFYLTFGLNTVNCLNNYGHVFGRSVRCVAP
jgi:hypothetical protein